MGKNPSAEIDKIRDKLVPFLKTTKASKTILFGSMAAGTGTRKSDVDLMIIEETDKRFFDRYNDYAPIQHILSDRSVDILIYTPDELTRISHRPFIQQILNSGQVIYEC